MASVFFTPRGIGTLQRLSGVHIGASFKLVGLLSREEEHEVTQLARNRHRSSFEAVHFLWGRDSENRIVITWVGTDETASGHQNVDDALRNFPAKGEPEAWPAFEWTGRTRRHWLDFVYGDFRLQPRLTERQKLVLEEHAGVLESGASRDRPPLLIQAGPGTGKSITALLTACRLRQNRPALYVAFMSAAPALEDFRRFPAVQKAFGDRTARDLTTVQEWLLDQVRGDAVPPPQAALDAFRLSYTSWRNRQAEANDLPSPESLTMEHLDAFEWEVVEQAGGSLVSRSPVPALGDEKLASLWRAELAERGYRCRTDLAHAVAEHLPAPPAGSCLLIIDEVQDLLPSELSALNRTREAWITSGCNSQIWLVGDLGQRLSSARFTWDDLPGLANLDVTKAVQLKINYRSTRRVAYFANALLTEARNVSIGRKARGLPEAAEPSDTQEDGEPIGLLIVPEGTSLETILETYRTQRDNSAYFRLSKSDVPHVLFTHSPDVTPAFIDTVVHSSAQGRDFEAATLVGMTRVAEVRTLDEIMRLYALVTRVHARLLLVVTPREEAAFLPALNLTEPHRFASIDEAVRWVLDQPGAIAMRMEPAELMLQLTDTDTWPEGLPFQDTWEILYEAGLSPSEWEQTVWPYLLTLGSRHLDELVRPEVHPWLRCLGQRLRREWMAAEAAAHHFLDDAAPRDRKVAHEEHVRLVDSISRELIMAGRPFDAARVRYRAIGEEKPNLPMSHLLGAVGELSSLLRRHVLDSLSPENKKT